VCKAYATLPDHHDQHKSLHESHIQGQATHAEFTAPPLQRQRITRWEPIGSNATGYLPPTATHRCHAVNAAPTAWRDSKLPSAGRTTTKFNHNPRFPLIFLLVSHLYARSGPVAVWFHSMGKSTLVLLAVENGRSILALLVHTQFS
jgi:hypothetical protein